MSIRDRREKQEDFVVALGKIIQSVGYSSNKCRESDLERTTAVE